MDIKENQERRLSMRIICILCDQEFQPDKLQVKKLYKHPHKIQICPACKDKINKKLEARQMRKSTIDP